MHNITIDFNNPGLPQVIDVMQSDSQSRFIGLTLYDGGVPYSAPSGAVYTVEYHGQGANNTGWYDTIQLPSGTRKAVVVSSSSPNVVTLELAEQALRVNGKVEVSLCVVNNTGYKLNTFPIICRVTGAPYVDPVSVRSFFYVTGLTSDQWTAYVTACQDAQKRAEDAAAKFVTDPTLSLSGKAADAKATGEAVGQLKEDLVKSDLAVNTITPNVLSATKYDGKKITSDVISEIYNNNGGTYDLTQKLKPTDKVIPRIWFDDGTYLPKISGLVLILQDDKNETVEQITFCNKNNNSLENATKAFLLTYNATSLTPFLGKVIKGITLEYKDFSDKYYGSKEKYNPTLTDLKKSIKILDAVTPNILMNSEYNGVQFNQNVIDKMYNNTIDIPLNEQIKGKIIPNIIFTDGTNIGNVSGYVARIYSDSTLLEEITLGNETTQDLSTATAIKFKTYRNDTASVYIGKIFSVLVLQSAVILKNTNLTS